MDGPLVGRDPERAALGALIERACAGLAAIGLISGEAGVGKSALVRDLVADTGVVAFEGFGIREGGSAYGPLVEAARAILRRDPSLVSELAPALRSELAALVPELGAAGERLDRSVLIEAVRVLVVAAAATHPVALVLDDMHWSDDGTLDLLPSLARSLVEAPVVLLVMFRTDDLPRGHGMRRLRSELRRARLLDELTVGPLGAPAVRELLERAVGAPVDPSLCEAVIDRTDGVPFFVSELGLALAARDRLVDGSAGLVLAAGADLPLPESVRDAVLLRAANLSPESRRVVGVASVAGQRFDVEAVVAIAALDDWPDDPALGGIVVEQPGGRMAFRQALVRDAFYGELPWLARRRLHRQVAEHLEAGQAPPRIVAEHWSRAGDREHARRSFLAAANAYCELHAYRDGVRAAQRALELWPDDAALDEGGRLDALEALARCAELGGQSGEAVEVRREALDARRRQGEPMPIADACRRLAGALEVQGRWEEALVAREEAAQAYANAGAVADAATERLATAAHLRSAGSLRAALTMLDAAARDARTAGRLDLQARIGGLEGNVRTRMGDVAGGLDQVRAALSVALEHNLTSAAGEIYQRLADSLEHAGDYAAARATYDEAFAFCAASGLDPTAQVCLACLSAVLRQNGDWERAASVCRDVLASGDATVHARGVASSTLGSILALRGDARRARALLVEARSIARSIELLPVELMSEWGLALLDWTGGDLSSAATRCRDVLERWRRSEDRYYAVPPLRWATSVLAEIGDGTGARACTAALAEILANSGQAEAASALAHGLGETALLDDRADQAADHFARAIALLEHVDAPLEVMESQRRGAAALVALGRRDESVELLASAYRTARRLKAQALVRRLADALADLGESADRRLGPREAEQLGHEGLSRRELDIVRRVATGRTNREIAHDLFLSVRTVDMHVRNSLRKLSCRSRADAARRASELGLLRSSGDTATPPREYGDPADVTG
jgi:DNA-binding NarL/FixJ family response regulator